MEKTDFIQTSAEQDKKFKGIVQRDLRLLVYHIILSDSAAKVNFVNFCNTQ